MQQHEPVSSAADLKRSLESLETERALAALAGLSAHPLYAADLASELAATRRAFVGAAVAEIASLRARLDGPLVG